MTPATARDAPARSSGTGVSQKPGGMLPGILRWGDSGWAGRRGTYRPRKENKIRRPGNPICLTPVARGYNISLDWGN